MNSINTDKINVKLQSTVQLTRHVLTLITLRHILLSDSCLGHVRHRFIEILLVIAIAKCQRENSNFEMLYKDTEARTKHIKFIIFLYTYNQINRT